MSLDLGLAELWVVCLDKIASKMGLNAIDEINHGDRHCHTAAMGPHSRQ